MPANTVEVFYDQSVEREWQRLDRHKMEFVTTSRALKEHIRPGSRILDSGGGPGRYAIALALEGHHVTLLDLSSGNIRFASNKAREYGATLDGFWHGNAMEMPMFADNQFDAVLLMGPLYHLIDEADRLRAICEARRVLAPDGVLFAAFISRFAFLSDMLKKAPGDVHNRARTIDELLAGGVNLDSGNGGFTDAHFIHPMEIRPLMESCGFSTLRLAALEPFVAPVEPAINALPPEDFNIWADICYRYGPDPVTWGSAEHMLYIGRRAEKGLGWSKP